MTEPPHVRRIHDDFRGLCECWHCPQDAHYWVFADEESHDIVDTVCNIHVDSRYPRQDVNPPRKWQWEAERA